MWLRCWWAVAAAQHRSADGSQSRGDGEKIGEKKDKMMVKERTKQACTHTPWPAPWHYCSA